MSWDLDYVARTIITHSDASVPQYSGRVTVDLCVNKPKVLLAGFTPAPFWPRLPLHKTGKSGKNKEAKGLIDCYLKKKNRLQPI